MHTFSTTLLALSSLLFISCQESTTIPTLVDIDSIHLDEKNISLYSTDTLHKISATVQYKDASSTAVTQKVKWNSSNFNLFNVTKGELNIGTINGGDANLSISYKKFSDSTTVHINTLTSFTITYPDINSTGTGSYTFSAYGNFDNNETNRTITKNIVWSINGGVSTNVVDGVATLSFATGDSNVTATMFGDTNASSPIAPITAYFRVQ